eukprot:94202_1
MLNCVDLIDELTIIFQNDITLSSPDNQVLNIKQHTNYDANARELQLCSDILEDMMTRKAAIPFLAPVDWITLNLPDYPLIIQNPMDLHTVKTKLENFDYQNANDFARDMRLIWYNAQIYNVPGTDIYNNAHIISQEFEIKFNKIFVERMNINPLHKQIFFNKTIKQKSQREQSNNKQLNVTELDDFQLYFNANTNIIPNFDLGIPLKFILKPKTTQDFTANFRVCCKYGLNAFIKSYLDSITLPYTQLLNESMFPNVICEIITQYVKSNLTLLDLMITTNNYGETGLCLAAKYGQSKTCELIINRCKKYVPNHVIIAWINSATSKQTPLQWCLTSYSSDSWAKIKDNVLETIMVLLTNGAVVCLGSSRRRSNAYVLANKKGLGFESLVLKAYLSVEKGEFKTPLQFALHNKNESLFKFFKNYIQKQ